MYRGHDDGSLAPDVHVGSLMLISRDEPMYVDGSNISLLHAGINLEKIGAVAYPSDIHMSVFCKGLGGERLEL